MRWLISEEGSMVKGTACLYDGDRLNPKEHATMDANRIADPKDDPLFREFSSEILKAIAEKFRLPCNPNASPSNGYSYSQARADHQVWTDGERMAKDRLN